MKRLPFCVWIWKPLIKSDPIFTSLHLMSLFSPFSWRVCVCVCVCVSVCVCVCLFSCTCVCAIAHDPLISVLLRMAPPDTLASHERWAVTPYIFTPCTPHPPSPPLLCPLHSSFPLVLPLSLFCVSTDVWNYSGMEGWIPPWRAERRREPFVQ